MDEDISRWIMEFLLQHSISDQLINKVLSKLRVSNRDFRFKKAILLRSIQSEISEASVTETVLDCLETVANLDSKEGLRIAGSLKAAFCAVAVECTIKYLGVGGGGDDRFFDTAKRLWRGKVGSLLAEKRELVAMEKGKGILKENLLTRRKHIAHHRRTRGPVRITDNEKSNSDVSCSKYDTLPTPEVKRVKEALKSSSFELHALVKDPLPSALRQAEALASDIARTQNQNHSMEAQNAVSNHDPLVETRNIDEYEPNPTSNVNAEPVQANESNHRNPMANHEPSAGEWSDVEHVPNPSSDKNVEGVQANKSNYGNPSCSNQNILHRPSLMERNSTARTYEWDNSIDDSPGGPSNHINRFHLPSPKRKVVSPLRKYEVVKLARRRKKKRWSLEEEEALRRGVEELGRGNWKLILTSNPEVFCERTEVDLKDKWRNMTRY